MTEPRWMKHGHHDTLFEPIIGSIERRIKSIRVDKPADEIPTRLRLIGEIDPDGIPLAVREVWVVCEQAGEDWWRALVYYSQALEDHHDELEALHKRVCVADCPWNGKTIFPEADQ